MPHVEASACEKPVLAVNAMAFRDTMVHGETAYLAEIAREIVISETVLGEGAGERAGEHIVFTPPRIADYRASVADIAEGLRLLLNDAALRERMGVAGRQRAVRHYDYRAVARQFVEYCLQTRTWAARRWAGLRARVNVARAGRPCHVKLRHRMNQLLSDKVTEAKAAALQVLLHNAHGPFHGLPRTAGWGYPEAYTRDFMISALGILASGNAELIAALRRVFLALAANQTPLGHIPSLAHDPGDVGASDTTPLFLMSLAIYRQATGEEDFLEDAAQKALTWMRYQSPG